MLYSLDSRCQDILLYLLYLDEYITIQDLSLEKNISKRSVYYDLCKINDWLQSHDIDSIIVERKKGIWCYPYSREFQPGHISRSSDSGQYLL